MNIKIKIKFGITIKQKSGSQIKSNKDEIPITLNQN